MFLAKFRMKNFTLFKLVRNILLKCIFRLLIKLIRMMYKASFYVVMALNKYYFLCAACVRLIKPYGISEVILFALAYTRTYSS